MIQTIHLVGIRAEGRHGARAGERDAPQPFLLDLHLDVAAMGDDLASTADYRTVVETARSFVADQSFALIETLAERIAALVAQIPGVFACRAVVHKPAAADRLGAADVAAEATVRISGEESAV